MMDSGIIAGALFCAAIAIAVFLLLKNRQALDDGAALAKKRDPPAAQANPPESKGKGKRKGALARMRARAAVSSSAADAVESVEVEEAPEQQLSMQEIVQKLTEDDVTEEEREKLLASLPKAERKRVEKRLQKRAEKQGRSEEIVARERAKAEKLELRQQEEEEKELARKKEEEELENLRQQKLKEEQEEYEKWKDLISVENTGSGEQEIQQESQGMLQEFIDFIKKQKIVELEEIAVKFGLKTQEAINRVTSLEKMGYITGVIDDRGKFIYISQEEMQKVADFINDKGRVSIETLVSQSNKLIDLTAEE